MTTMDLDLRWTHLVGDELPAGLDDREHLGGKGKSLQDMRSAGFPVPPAFVISTEACAWYFDNGQQWPPGLDEQIDAGIAHLEREMGQRFGQGSKPLLVSVRSGAARSMPGMMDTLLNVGLTPALAGEVEDVEDFYARYADFLIMYAETCDGIDRDIFDGCEDFDQMVERYEEQAQRSFPLEPRALLRACIATVFRSWNNERAIDYRKRHDIHGLKGTAVTVQAMFPSQVSGICFTVDPTDCESGAMVIESSYGLGESVVSGDVAPDRFDIDRDSGAERQRKIGCKASAVRALGDAGCYDPDAPSLSGEQLQELVALCQRLERHMGMPLDIEWGLVDGRFALLQSRAIRGLDVARAVEPGRQAEIARLRRLAGDGRRVWVSHNLSETLRHPTPMTWDMVRRFMRGDGGFGRLYQDLGYLPSQRVREEGFLELICGQIYADPERLAELFWDGLPMGYEIAEVARDPKLLDQAPTRFDPEGVDGSLLLRLPKIVLAMLRSSRRLKRLRREARQRFDEQVLPAWRAWVDEERSRDLAGLGDEQLLTVLEERCARTLDDFAGESLKPGFIAGLALASAQATLADLAGEEEAASLVGTLTAGLEGDLTAQQDQLLYRVAQGEGSLDTVIERYGHRAVGEMELMNERWWEDRAYLEQTLPRLAGGRDPSLMHHDKATERRAASALLADRLRRWGGESFRELIEADLALACELLPYRENGKYYLMQGWDLIRRCLCELGLRSGLGNDVFFLRYDELAGLAQRGEELLALAAERRLAWKAAQRLDPARIVDSDDLDGLGLAPAVEVGGSGVLQGEAMAPGVGSGPARIVSDPNQAGDIGRDYILVCSSTDPGWTPLFMNARGLVVERGGTLSHGAIVARDFGIPAVVCPGATTAIHDGAVIRVDGDRGCVQIEGEA